VKPKQGKTARTNTARQRAAALPTCHCGTRLAYDDCCGPLHRNLADNPAPTAQDLMRSRYSAYVLGLNDYLMATWHMETRPSHIETSPGGLQWLGLEVRRDTLIDEEHAEVEFVARSKLNGRARRLHEVSRFVRENGRWLYVDGQML
jgi:SEC-C motif-containing protein